MYHNQDPILSQTGLMKHSRTDSPPVHHHGGENVVNEIVLPTGAIIDRGMINIPQLDPVTNEIIETNEQIIINHRSSAAVASSSDHPVIVRPAADWEVCQPTSQSPHNQAIMGEVSSA